MKNVFAAILAVLFCFMFIGHGSAVPTVELEELPEVQIFETGLKEDTKLETGRADRHRRVTCDVLSVSTPIGSVNHAACAAHCLSMRKGYRGGRCIDGVCNCRR